MEGRRTRSSSLALASIALVHLGFILGATGTTYEIYKLGGFSAPVLDGESTGLHWVGWGNVISIAGILVGGVAAVCHRLRITPTLAFAAAGTFLICLYWLSPWAIHVGAELFDIRWDGVETGFERFIWAPFGVVYAFWVGLSRKFGFLLWYNAHLTCVGGLTISLAFWVVSIAVGSRSIRRRTTSA